MHLLQLLGQSLKDDDVIDILEGLEMDVINDFDRLHEGQTDKCRGHLSSFVTVTL